MKRIWSVSSFIVLLLGILFAIPFAFPVHATLIGTVCLGSTDASFCPAIPPSLSGAVGTQLRVPVLVQGSDGMRGFDLVLLADSSILKPVGIDLTGTVLLGNPIILIECLQGGIPVHGPICGNTDNRDTLHLAALSALGSPNTVAPTTGLLFTAIYNVTGIGSTSLGYQIGCSRSSINGTNVCIDIVNGTYTPDPQTSQTASFSNGVAPTFSISDNPANLSIPGFSRNSTTITVTSLDGFSGTVTLSDGGIPPTITTTYDPTRPVRSINVTLVAGGTSTAVLTIIDLINAQGSYYITLTGISGALFKSILLQLRITAPPPDFAISYVTPIQLTRHSTGMRTLLFAGRNGFAGAVNLNLTVFALVSINTQHVRAPVVFLNASRVVLNADTTVSALLLTITAQPNGSIGEFGVAVTASSGSLSRYTTFSVTVIK